MDTDHIMVDTIAHFMTHGIDLVWDSAMVAVTTVVVTTVADTMVAVTMVAVTTDLITVLAEVDILYIAIVIT